MRQGRQIFSSTVVRWFVETTETSTGKEANKEVSDIMCVGNQLDTNGNLNTDDETRMKKGEPCEGIKRVCEKLPTPFVESRASERKGLIEIGTLKVINRDEVADRSRNFGSRFVDTVKYRNSGARTKG